MAGDVSPIVNKWMLDYLCQYAWEEFKKEKTLQPGTVDLMSGILAQVWEGEEKEYDKKLFLTTLARLKDGEEVNIRYDIEDSEDDISPLEDLVPHFFNLVELQSDEKVKADGKECLPLIKFESVCAYIRAENFEKAEEVLEKWFPAKEHRKNKQVKNIRAIIKAKNKDDVLPVSYTEFISAITEYLESIVNGFEEPLLIKSAQLMLQGSPCKHKELEVSDNRRKALSNAKEDAQENNNSTTDKISQKRKLRRLWDENIKDMFGGETTDKPSTSEELVAGTSAAIDKPSSSTHCTPEETENPSMEPDSPVIQYRKNKNRVNRHDEVDAMSSTRCSDIESESVAEYPTFGSRRKMWSTEEMCEFYEAVNEIGVGKWAQIRDHLNTTRTSVMLKDKWRNMIKNGDIDALKAQSRKKKRTN